MKMVLMGTGTSHGVPVIGCDCEICKSADRRDKRKRCSAYIFSPANIVIDTGPEFRMQALEFEIKSLDAVLITHGHADHLNGLDDLRVFSHTKSVDPSNKKTNETAGPGLPIYTNAQTLATIRKSFSYIFTPVVEGGSKPKLFFVDAAEYSQKNPLKIKGLEIIPVPLAHGSTDATGWILKDSTDRGCIAYLTDCNSISDSSFDLLRSTGKIEHLVIDALREKPHSTHFSFLEAMEAAEKIGPCHTWFTHLTHDMFHTDVQSYIDRNIEKFPLLKKIKDGGGSVCPGYDGLVLEN